MHFIILQRRTVYWWIKRHAVEGIEGLRDRPRGSRGRATTVEQDKALLEAHNNKSMRSTRDFAIKYNVHILIISSFSLVFIFRHSI